MKAATAGSAVLQGARAAAARIGQRRALASVVQVSSPAAAPGPVTLGDLQNKTKPVVTMGVNSNVLDAVRKMTSEAASTLFVEDGGYIVGIVKEKNIIHHVDSHEAPMATELCEMMETDILYGSLSSTVRESLALLNESKQDHLPVLSFSGPLSGEPVRVERARVLDVTSIISAKHIIGQFYCETIGAFPEALSEEERERLEAEAQKHLKLPTVKNLMKIKQGRSEAKGELGTMVLNTLVEDRISVAETIRQMAKFDKGSVAVMDICRDVPLLKGIVTEQDIIRRALSLGLDLDATPVIDIMTSSGLATVTTKESLLGCAFKMVDANVRHLPVVSPKGSHVLAMISSKDVVSFFCETWEH